MDRRRFIRHSGLLAGVGAAQAMGLAGCVAPGAQSRGVAGATAGLPFYDAPGAILPIRADIDRIFKITVCLRPFRAAGPRIEAERIGRKFVVHSYGHGGSGWSLSWGSAELAVRDGMEALPAVRECAVIGCGAIGLTTALTAQRVGMQVTIYAKERPPLVRSSRATGSWTPDSRIALTSGASAWFPGQWEKMARTAFAMHQSYLGVAGAPVEWTDRYLLQDQADGADEPDSDSHGFAEYRDQIKDLTPRFQLMPQGSTPFPNAFVKRTSSLTFNVASYSRALLEEFELAGGKVETREFHSPSEFGALTQKLVFNCTGYGARALCKDDSIVPIRGQIAWLIPQDGINYGIYYKQLNVLARRDGIVIQPSLQGDDTGWNDSNEEPDRSEAEAGVRMLQALYARMQPR